jgi:hypothetical protein
LKPRTGFADAFEIEIAFDEIGEGARQQHRSCLQTTAKRGPRVCD